MFRCTVRAEQHVEQCRGLRGDSCVNQQTVEGTEVDAVDWRRYGGGCM
jgi:hypothetical protein